MAPQPMGISLWESYGGQFLTLHGPSASGRLSGVPEMKGQAMTLNSILGYQEDSLVCVTAAGEVTEGTGKFQAKEARAMGGEERSCSV